MLLIDFFSSHFEPTFYSVTPKYKRIYNEKSQKQTNKKSKTVLRQFILISEPQEIAHKLNNLFSEIADIASKITPSKNNPLKFLNSTMLEKLFNFLCLRKLRS